MNMLAPLRLALSVRTAMHAMLASLLMIYFTSWLGYRSATILVCTSLCFVLYHVYRYKVHLIKYTGRLSGLHMQCAGLMVAIHLIAATSFIMKEKTMYTVAYALTALGLLWEYIKGAQRQRE